MRYRSKFGPRRVLRSSPFGFLSSSATITEFVTAKKAKRNIIEPEMGRGLWIRDGSVFPDGDVLARKKKTLRSVGGQDPITALCGSCASHETAFLRLRNVDFDDSVTR
jgi:hypothetical protein